MGGEAANVNIAASVAQSGLQNNYLSHTEIANFKKELLECSQNQSADCSEILNRYLQLSQENNAALIACGDDAACLLPHLMKIAAAEASGAAEDLLFGMSGHQYGFYQGAFTSLQEEGISLVQDVQISQAELDQLTIEQHKREFVNLQCGGQLDDACSAAFDEELTRIEEDNAYRRQVTEEFFESIGVVLDFTPVGDVLGIIDGCGSLGYACAMAVGVTVLGPVADAAKIVSRVGDDLVDAAGNIYKKLDGSDTFTDINGNSFQLDNNGDLVRVDTPDVVVNSVPDNWTSVSDVGNQINTPSGFSTYRTPDGNLVHVSPSGLKYGRDNNFGNRVDHVLSHTVPNPNKPKHTVFNVQGDDTLNLVDEAWKNKGSPLPNDPGVYIVDMGRPVGTAGETTIRVVVRPGTDEIITAYPQ